MEKSISEIIREAMVATGLSDWEISRQTGVSQPQLWAFRNGTSNPKASTIDALGRWLGLTVTPVKSRKKASKRQPSTAARSKPPHAESERENDSHK